MSNIKMKVTLASMILVAVLLALSVDYHGGIVPEVRAQGPGCSLRTLQGTYGNSFQFLNTFPSNAGQPIIFGTHTPGAGIGLVTFDGQGNYVGQTTASIGGLIVHVTVWGTYTVNADCTGSRVLNFSSGPPANLELVIVEHGKEIHELGVGQGEVAVGILKKQF